MRIQSTAGVHQSNLKCLVYGRSGIGKTTLAKTLEGPALIISAESGLASLHGTKIDFIDITQDDNGFLLSPKARLDKLGEIYKQLQSPEMQKKYNVIFIDSLTEIADTMVTHLAEVHTDSKDTYKMWGLYTVKMINIVRSFRDLPHYNVVFTALEDEVQDDTKLVHYQPMMSGTKVKAALVPMFDEVFRYTIIDDKRKLITDATKSSIAKDRSGKLTQLEEPDLSKVFNKIRGSK
jgi:phage nucleotide-binding protein